MNKKIYIPYILLNLFLSCVSVFSEPFQFIHSLAHNSFYTIVENDLVYAKRDMSSATENGYTKSFTDYFFVKNSDYKIYYKIDSETYSVNELSRNYQSSIPFYEGSVIFWNGGQRGYVLKTNAYVIVDDVIPEPCIVIDGKSYSDTDIYIRNFNTIDYLFPTEESSIPGVEGSGYKYLAAYIDGNMSVNIFSLGIYNLNNYFTTEGFHSLTLYSEDNLGNVSNRTFNIYFDKTNPSINSVASSSSSMWNRSSVTVSANAIDSVSGIDNSSWKNRKTLDENFSKKGNANNRITLDRDGIFRVQFEVSDNAGNSVCSEFVNVNIDKTPPEIFITDFNEEKWCNRNVFKVYGSDNLSGINDGSWSYICDSSARKNGTNIDPLSEGIHEIDFFVTDVAGNDGFKKFIIKVDTYPPVIENFSCVTKSSSIIPEIYDLTSGIDEEKTRWSINDKDWINQAEINLPEGEYDITYYIEDFAGNGAIKKQHVIIDRTAPVIDFKHPAFINEREIELSDFIVEDSLYSKITVVYNFDGRDDEVIPLNSDSKYYLPIYKLSEGSHVLYVTADDGHDNYRTIEKKFCIDRTSPEINDIEFISCGKVIENNDFIRCENPSEGRNRFSINAKIEYMDLAGEEKGIISKFLFSINNGNFIEQSSENFYIEQFEEGQNNISFKIVDGAGNESEIKNYCFIKNSQIPLKPVLTSKSHKSAKSVVDSERRNKGLFNVKSISIDDNEIEEIHLSLSVCNLDEFGNIVPLSVNSVKEYENLVVSGENNEVSIEFEKLEDNNENEFYLLSAYLLSYNSLESDRANYVFRIDTQLPEDFSAWLYPQIDNSQWYCDKNVQLNWIQGKDRSGIAKIQYCLSEAFVSVDDVETLPWMNVPTLEKDNLWIEVEGEKNIFIRCVDNAGNYDYVTLPVKIDCVPPVNNDFTFYAKWKSKNKSKLQDSIVLEWNECTDEQSGLDYYILKFQNLTESDSNKKIYYYDTDKKNSECRNFNAENDWLIELYAVDKAGNEISKDLILLGKNSNCDSIEYSYSTYIDDLLFSGRVLRNIETNEMKLVDTGKVSILSGNAFNDGINSIKDFSVEKDNCIFEKGQLKSFTTNCIDKDLFFNTEENDSFKFRKMSFDRDLGIILSDVDFVLTDKKNISKKLNFENLTIGFPSHFMLHSDFAECDLSKIGFDYVDIENCSKVKVISNRIFYLDKILCVPEIDFNIKSNDSSIFVIDSSSTLNCEEFYGKIDDDNILLIGDSTKLTVVDSYVQNDRLFVNNSLFSVYDGTNRYSFYVKDFYIDLKTGRIESGAMSLDVFDIEGNKLEVVFLNGIQVPVSDIVLYDDGFHISLNFECAIGSINFHNAVIDDDGLHIEKNFSDAFDFKLFGFKIRALNYSLMSNSDGMILKISKGELFYQNIQISISDLYVDPLQNDRVIVPCRSIEDFVSNTDYGSPLSFTNIEIGFDGIYSDLKVLLPQSKKQHYMKSVSLKSDGTIKYEGNSLVFDFYELNFYVDSYSFDGKTFHFIKGKIDTSLLPLFEEQDHVDSLCFSDIVCSYKKVFNGGLWNKDKLHYFHGKFNITGENLNITEKGLSLNVKSSGTLEYGESIISYSLEYSNLYILGLNKIYCFSESQSEPLQLNNYDIYLLNTAFDFYENKPCLIAEKEFLNIPENGKYKKLNFGRLVVFDNGEILCDEAECMEEFSSSNNVRFKCAQTLLKNSGIYLSGKMFFDKIDGSVESKNFDFKLEQNLSLLTIRNLNSFTWKLNDWNVISYDVSVDNEGLFCNENYVQFNGGNLSLGKIHFNRFIEIDSFEDNKDRQKINIYSDNCYCSGFTLSGGEIITRVFFTLPDYLNSEIAIAEKVYLFFDGTYRTDTIIKQFEVSKKLAKVKFEDLKFANNHILISKADFTFYFGDNIISMYLNDLKIHSSGRIEIDNIKASQFQIWNTSIHIKKLELDSEGVKISGKANLPYDLPGRLAGKKAVVNDLTIGWDGHIKSADIQTQLSASIPLFGEWSLEFNNCGIKILEETPYLFFKRSSIVFPSDFLIKGLNVENASINLITKEFDYSKIECSVDAKLSFSGITYTLDYISISKDFTVGLKGGACFSGDNFPDFLRNKTTADVYLEISKEGELIKLETRIDGLNGKLSSDVKSLEIKNGILSIIKDENDYVADIRGYLCFSNEAPDGIQSLNINIEDFKYNLVNHQILSLKASAIFPEIKIFEFNFENICVGIEWNQDDERNIMLAGDIILPQVLPDGLAGQKISIEEFIINKDGKISSLKMSFDYIGRYQFMNGLILENPSIRSDVIDFSPVIDLSCNLILGKEYFPDGIGGICAFARIKFSGDGINFFNCSCDIEDLELFNLLELKKSRLEFGLNEFSNIEIGFSGKISFLDKEFFPEGLSNYTADIRKFIFSTDGSLVSLDIDFNIKEVSFFNSVKLRNIDIKFFQGIERDLRFSMAGDLKIANPYIPQELCKVQLNLNKIEFSNLYGLVDFNVSVKDNIRINIFDYLSLKFSELSFSKDGFSCSAVAKISLMDITDDLEFGLDKFSMDWNGTIRNFVCTINHAGFSLAGFSCSVDGITFGKDNSCQDGYYIGFRNMKFSLPENCGGYSLKILNAEIKDGKFYGDVETTDIVIEVAGFNLVFMQPSLKFKDKELSFEKIQLICPDFIGNASVAVYGAKISASNGLEISGISVRLPAFYIGDQFGFRDVEVTFIKENDSFLLKGGGKLAIPACGEIGAILAFTKQCPDYPIGIKQAFFSFETNGFFSGIPLGTTGLFLSGIRGGMAFGAPDEVHPVIRGLFSNNGIRIQLGVTIKDFFDGYLIEMTPDTWIDVKNFTWAFYGDVVVFKGIVHLSGSAYAVLNKFGFVTGMNFNIIVVRGEVSFAIFRFLGQPMFTGKAKAEFGLPKGCIFEKSFKLLFMNINFCLPPWDMWIFSLGAEFGNFTNGIKGFKTYVSCFGYDLGLAAAWGYIKVGNVSSFQLYDPLQCMAIETALSNMKISGIDNNSSVNSNDGFPSDIFVKDQKVFDVDGGQSKISVACAYIEDEPVIKLISPSGDVYYSTDENAEIYYFDNYYLYSVSTPEGGRWKLNVMNAAPLTYDLQIIAVSDKPKLSFSELNQNGDILSVSGCCDKEDVYFYLTDEDQIYSFELGSVKTDKDGLFNTVLEMDNFYDGKYYLAAKVIDSTGSLSQNIIYEDFPIIITHEEKEILPPENFRIYEDLNNDIHLIYENSNGGRCYGYFIEINDLLNKEKFIIDAGNSTNYKLLEENSGKEFEYRVSSYDKNRKSGVWSEIIHHKIGDEKKIINKPVLHSSESSFDICQGEYVSSILDIDIEDYIECNDSYNYITGVAEKQGNNISVIFKDESKILNGKALLEYTVSVSDECLPGTYKIKCMIMNEGNVKIFSEYYVIVNVKIPELKIEGVYPKTINGNIDNEIVLWGKGFSYGTRYSIDDVELKVVQDSKSDIRIKKVVAPENNWIGKKNIVVERQDGKKDIIEIEVGNPFYEITSRVKTVNLKPDSQVYIPLDIRREYGFSNEISLKAISSDYDLLVEVPKVIDESFVQLKVYAKSNIKAGNKTIVIEGDNGNKINLDVIVTSKNINYLISIESIYPAVAYPGEKFTVYGSGFDSSTKFFMNNIELDVIEMNENRAVFVLDRTQRTGMLYAKNNEISSNSIKVIVRNHYLNISAEKYIYQINEGRDTEILFSVNDSNGNVKMNISADENAPFEARLVYDSTKSSVYKIKVVPKEKVINGQWTITLNCENGKCFAKKEFIISSENSPEIDDREIYCGIVNKYYYARIKLSNSIDNYEFSISKGLLPKGLELSDNGIIKGFPVESGKYRFTVKASCRDKVLEKEIYIGISGFKIHTKNVDYGNSNCMAISKYKYENLYKNIESSENYILLGNEDKYYLVVNTLIKAFTDGYLSWKLDIADSIIDVRMSDESIIALDSSNRLYAINSVDGRIIRQWSNVDNFSSNEMYVMVHSNSKVQVFNSKSFELVDVYNFLENETGNNFLWHGNLLFTWQDCVLRKLLPVEKCRISTGQKILNCMSDGKNIYAVCSNGIYILNYDLMIENFIEMKIDDFVSSAVSDKAVVLCKTKILIIEKIDMENYHSYEIEKPECIDSFDQTNLKIVTDGILIFDKNNEFVFSILDEDND